ncbi:MAG: cyclic GMP-AMP synthase DncV-like nucleotidyltransferase, partial [Nostoc sp.]
QSQMCQFDQALKLKRFDENEILREKRDRILNRLDQGLKAIFECKGLKPPKYINFDQGSYAMGTGTKPIDGNYDIDTGIQFKISKDDYSDPVKVKEWVYLALVGHTKRVEIRRPCVTVFYQQDDEPIYHVDLAIYSDKDYNPDGKMYLAKGKLNSSASHRFWQESDPQALINLIKNHFSDTDDDQQFRRTIRYLKRWKDVKFSSDGNAAPIGIGITVAAYYWFNPVYTRDSFTNKRSDDDLEALQGFVKTMLTKFQDVNSNSNTIKRLIVELPVSPHCDLFEAMTDNQMADFQDKLEILLDAIEEAQQKVDPVEACKILQKQFGDAFPVPSQEDTAQKRPRPITSSSASA